MKPNIVFLTTGSANSTICMRMLGALGWNLGDVDPVYCEHRPTFRVNRNWDEKAAAALLGILGKPWALKDPLFPRMLPRWRVAFAPYRPLLLWVTKDIEYVVASSVRRFKSNPAVLRQRQALCQQHFASWPYAKLKLDVTQIDNAVALYDATRSFKGG